MEEAKKAFKQFKWETLVMAIVEIVLGIIFIVNPGESINVICKIAGVALIVLGVVLLAKYFAADMLLPQMLLLSIVAILLGIYFIAKSGVIAALIALPFGLLVVVGGVEKTQQGIDAMKNKDKNAWIYFVLAAVYFVLGCLVLFGDDMMTLLGISLIVEGVCDVVVMLWLSAGVHKIAQVVKSAEVEENGGEGTENTEKGSEGTQSTENTENAPESQDFGEIDEVAQPTNSSDNE